MKNIYGVIKTLILALVIYDLGQNFKTLTMEVRSLSGKVCNVDKARAQLLSEVEFRYKQGCRTGIEYPPEYRQDQTGFNPNSPTNWCHDEYLKIVPSIEALLGDVGK